MSGTQDLARLAEDPPAFDTELAGLHKQADSIGARIASAEQAAHREAGDKIGYGYGRPRAWGMSTADALAKAPQASAARDARLAELAPVTAAISAMNEVYSRAPWPRFFPSVTSSSPHIHASLGCRTLHIDTRMSWAPALSGKTEDVAVAELDEALCTVCFPSAPVALHNYVSRRSQAERDERADAKAARDAARDAKTLTDEEAFRVGGRHGDRVTTVSGCKDALRAPIATAAELAWYRSGRSQSGDPEFIARVTGNLADRLDFEAAAAATAERVLLAREERLQGTGLDAAGVAKIRANAGRRAAKDW
jgi:hypothetical protein